MRYVIKHTPSGWVIELCFPVGEKGYYRTAQIRWRSRTEYLQSNFVFPDYDSARVACDKQNGIVNRQ